MEMVTHQTIATKLIDYMNNRLSLVEIVAWAELILIDTPTESAEAHSILGYIAAADNDGFPLGWTECHEFLAQLSIPVHVELIESLR